MKRTIRFLFAVLVVATPVLVASLLLRVTYGTSLTDTVPTQTDEIIYWHQAATFAEAGFGGGYYTVDERTPRLGRFFNWGIAPPVFYGTFAAISGWPLWGIGVINLAALAAATALFIRLARLNVGQMAWLGLLLALYPPLILYAPTQLLEVLILAFALLLAGLFAQIFRRVTAGVPIGRGLALATFAAIFAAGLFRLPWALLHMPFLLLLARPTRPRQYIFPLLASALIGGVNALAYVMTSAPYPGNTLTRITNNFSLPRALRILGANIRTNLNALTGGDTVETLLRLAVALICIALALILAFHLVQSRRRVTNGKPLAPIWPEIGLMAYVLSVFFLFVLVIYDMTVFRGFRMLAAPLLFVLCFSVAFKRRAVLISMAICLILMLPTTLRLYAPFNAFETDAKRRAQAAGFAADYAARGFAFDPDAASAWCNVILLDWFYIYGETSVGLAVPAGMGISYPNTLDRETPFPEPMKARYIALSRQTYAAFDRTLHLQPLLDIPEGKIYVNRDSACKAEE